MRALALSLTLFLAATAAADRIVANPAEDGIVAGIAGKRIVADAAVSTRGRQGGRMLPVLLLDTSDRPDIGEFIRLHESFGPGDVEIQWGQVQGHEGTVALFLTCIRPMELFMVLEFDIVRQGILVEQALTGQGIYLTRAEHADDRLMKNLDRPKVIIDVPDTGFKKTWDDLFHEHLAKEP